MKFLDVKDFLKTHEDGKTATLSSPKGHTITVILSKLSPIQQEQVKRLKLSKGGEVKGVHKVPSKQSKGNSEAGDMAREAKLDKPQYRERHMENAKDSHREVLKEAQSMPAPKLQGLAAGGDVETEKDQQYDSSGYPVKPQTLGPPAPPDPVKASTMSNIFHADGGAIGRHMYADQEAPVAQEDAAPVAQQAQTTIEPVANAPGAQQIPMNANATINTPGEANLESQGLNQQQAVESAKGQAGAQNDTALLKAQAKIAEQQQQYYNDMKAHVDDFAQHLQTVDPNKYMREMDGGDKVAAAFGMLAGGFKQGLIGGDNPAVKWLDDRVKGDVARQQSEVDKKKNILGAYQDLYGKGNTALQLAKASTIDIHAALANKIANQLATPQAEATNKLLQAKWAAERETAMREASMDKAIQTSYGHANGAEAGAPQQSPAGTRAPTEDEELQKPLLGPNASRHLESLRYTPKAKDDLPNIQSKYDQAYKADAILNQLHDVHQSLFQDAKAGGGEGYMRRHDAIGAIPYAGDFLRKAVTDPVTATEVNKRYDANKTRIVGDIANALKGTNVGGEEIKKMVDDNSPEPQDTPELVAQKEKNIRAFVKNAARSGIISNWGLDK